MALDRITPRPTFWDYLARRRQEQTEEPLIAEFHDVPRPQPGWKALTMPNRDADFHRVPDPDFVEPPDDYER